MSNLRAVSVRDDGSSLVSRIRSLWIFIYVALYGYLISLLGFLAGPDRRLRLLIIVKRSNLIYSAAGISDSSWLMLLAGNLGWRLYS